MTKYRCTVTGHYDERTSRGEAPETFRKTYSIEAESAADAEANARSTFERAHGQQPTDEPVCELDSLVAIREAPESDVTGPERRRRLERAAAKDGATMDEVEAAKRANGHWPGLDAD